MEVEYFKEGQTVYSATYGEGVVDRVEKYANSEIKVYVKFVKTTRPETEWNPFNGGKISFTYDGRLSKYWDVDLFQESINFPENKPLT